jgi:hypothetical protein
VANRGKQGNYGEVDYPLKAYTTNSMKNNRDIKCIKRRFMMILNKHTIRGKKGSTVCYTIPNFHFDINDNHLKWDDFRFYTPLGESMDEEGFRYFDVPADEVLIERDDTLTKDLIIIATQEEGVEVIETLEGAEGEVITIGLEGDIIVSGTIPASEEEEITIDYKEVTNG